MSVFFIARWEARKIPAVKVTPQPLTDYTVSDAPGTAFSYFGYTFEVPWNGSFKTKESQKSSTTSGLVQLKFESGQDLLVIAPTNQRGLLSQIAEDQSSGMPNLGPVFGDLINRSAYDQYAALLNTSPASIRAFGPRAEAARGVTLLTIKAIALPKSLETGAFSFGFPDKRGFQVGDPRKSRHIQLEVLDLNGHYVEIVCETAKDTIRLTQPELNRILETLHPASSATDSTSKSAARN